MIGNRTKVFRFLLLAFLLLSALSACKDLFGPLDNPVDRESDNYQGYDTILNADDIKIFYPTNSRIAVNQPTFIVSEVRSASAYQIQISSSQSDFENNILFDKSDYDSNKINISTENLSNNVWYYWRARAQQSGAWGKWTEISSFIIGYTITYDGNGNTEGSVPIDPNIYLEGESVTVAQRPQGFSKEGYGFDSWNTESNGSGIDYNGGSTFIIGSESITLYAKWHVLSLWATGWNSYGQLGDGTTYSKSSPVKVMEGVEAVAAGYYHTMIIKDDGSLWATGVNWYGQLGDGTTSDKSSPVKVMEGVEAVAAGYSHTMIIKNDGSLWATGANFSGQLGDGTTYNSRSSPVKVMEDVKAVSAGYDHTMIIKNDGSLWVTGGNYDGQLGDGTTYSRSSPVKVMDNVKAVSAGGYHTMIIKNDGSLWATGYNAYGELGDGTTSDKSSPVKVMDNVEKIEAGSYYTFILK